MPGRCVHVIAVCLAWRWGWATERELVLLGEGSTPEARRSLDKTHTNRTFRAMPTEEEEGGGLWMMTSREVTEREPWRGWCNGGIKGIYGVEVCVEQLATDLTTAKQRCNIIDADDLTFPAPQKRARYHSSSACGMR